MLQKLTDPKYENCWVCCTDPADVARVESKTVISTRRQSETIPQCKEGVQGRLGRWMSPGDLEQALDVRTPGCMKGRTMYSAFEIEIKKRVKCIFTGKYYFSVSRAFSFARNHLKLLRIRCLKMRPLSNWIQQLVHLLTLTEVLSIILLSEFYHLMYLIQLLRLVQHDRQIQPHNNQFLKQANYHN